MAAAASTYARGEFDAAINGVAASDLKLAPFTRALEEWIRTGDHATEPRRRTIAVAFALEALWVATRTSGYLTSLIRYSGGEPTSYDPEQTRIGNVPGRIVHWAVQNLPSPMNSSRVDRTLWLATLGVAEDGQAWDRVEDEVVSPARKNFPDEPRFRLGGVLAKVNKKVGSLRARPFASRRHDVLRNEPMPAKGIDDAIKLFEPLLADTSMAGEIELRIGYLELRRDHWSSALVRFDAARTKTSEGVLRAAADYFAGWIYEQQKRTADAIAAYRRAHAITPLMRNLTMRLSTLLFLQNQRDEAYALLDPAVNARPVQTDLLETFERADARFVPEWLASIRKGLQ